ncbi:hypothetical protein [Mucilaginibacter paludis]|nr:hypothetical protein [Mucilaginibacter paludis]
MKFIGSHYLLFAALALAVWYGGVLFTFYRNEAKKLYAQQFPKPETPLPTVLADDEEFDLMGAPAEEYGVSTVLAHEVRFMQRKTMIPDEEMQGLIPDVLEEIKKVIQTVEAEEGDKADFISLFKLITVKYPRLAESKHLPDINDWLREHCPFGLDEDELAGLWA